MTLLAEKSMHSPLQKWLRLCLFNLLLVALIGIILRYKIAFSLPFVDQKYLLHGHSHFAFAGWITQALMVLLVARLGPKDTEGEFKKYHFLLLANLVTAYGMLITFIFQGYGLFSIIFSTLSVLVSYSFAIKYWKDLNRIDMAPTIKASFRIAVFFNAFSSLGVFTLAYMMATKHMIQNIYLASVYFYLHFQYNGWFFFACLGLLISVLIRLGANEDKLDRVFRLFALAAIPAYLLSVLWFSLPTWLYALIVIAVVLQIVGWLMLMQLVIRVKSALLKEFSPISRSLLLLSALAFAIKLLLQAGSVIPYFSKLAFGFRPIVIGYLHLVLLGLISFFIIGYIFSMKQVVASKPVITALKFFIAGVIFNEMLLMLQGLADLNYTGIPYINYGLLSAAVLMFYGLLALNIAMTKKI
ncbi:MAG: hypothetical protein ABI151_08495 [Chitinophagaceae bacterium]